jgi:hypothetical protein
MSLQTWIQEFYPCDANEIDTMKDAIDHSLRKWIGAREENLAKHKCHVAVALDRTFIVDSLTLERFYFDDDTCALCHMSRVELAETRPEWFMCVCCPLYKALDARSCCDDEDAYNPSVYLYWKQTGDPEPMIQALLRTKEQEEKDQ